MTMADAVNIFSCCDICGEDHSTEQCPELGNISIGTELVDFVTRARLTIPSNMVVADSRIGCIGVLAKELIPAKTKFGPFEARRTTHVFDDTGFFTLKVMAKDGTSVCLDTTDENECNWMCLVRPATSPHTQNLMAYQMGMNIYYLSTQDILPGEELQVWYTPPYAKKQGKTAVPDRYSKALLGHRIEPITNYLPAETQPENPVNLNEQQQQQQQQHQQEGGKESLEEQQQQDSVLVKDDHIKRGEIKKSFDCPRCGEKFATQTWMVQHLREHIVPTNKTLGNKKRGRGRPRLPITGTESLEPAIKRPRGRPRKIKQQEIDVDFDLDRELSDSADPIYDENDDSEIKEHVDYDDIIDREEGNDDNDDNDENCNDVSSPISKRLKTEDNTDVDYTPMKEVMASGRRVQPSRRRKGINSILAQDYIVSKIKKESVDSYEVEQKSIDTSSFSGGVESPSKNSVKRKRGRPKKINPSNDTSGIQINVNGLDQNDSYNDNSTQTEQNKDIERVKSNNAILASPPENDKNNPDSLEGSDVVAANNISAESKEGENMNIVPINEDETVDNEPNGVRDCEDKVPINDTQCDDVELKKRIGEIPSKESESQDKVPVSEVKVPDVVPANESKDMDMVSINDKSTEVNIDEDGNSSDESQFEQIGASNETLESMMEFDEDMEMYNCNTCHEKFALLPDAKAHAATHDNVRSFHCKVCDQTFPDRTELKQHWPACKTKSLYKRGKRKKGNKIKDQLGEENMGPHVCDICQQEFKTAQYLHRHMVAHTDIFSCQACLKTYSRKDSLQKHILKSCPQAAGQMKILHCELCFRVFSTVSGWKKHMAKCTLVQCKICNCMFNSKEDLDEHTCKENKMDDSGTVRYSCGKCPKSFQSLHYLRQHTLLHKKLHACSRCGKSLPSEEELESHSITCQTIETIKLLGQGRCERCNELFTSLKLFREHALSHSHPYQCEHCQRRFRKVGTLTNHECVNQGDCFACQTCSKTFKNEQSLDRHIKEHFCLRYQCSACGKHFHMKAEARDHDCEEKDSPGGRRILYTSDSTEVCSVCGKSFASRSNLVKHMALHGEKNFPCPHCEKRFHLEVYLKEHITCVHYKIFKHQCQHCGKMLKSKTGLNMHKMLFHTTNAETFPCSECNKTFYSKGNLKAHMYRHSSERRFKCGICNRTFKFPDQLSRHKIEHKIVEKIGCIYCEKQFCQRFELKRHLQIYHSGYVYVCGVCSSKCSHKHTLVRHYKRKHMDEFYLLSKEGYINSLLKHVSDLPGYKPTASQAPLNAEPLTDSNELNKLLPDDAVKALQSLSLGTCTLKEYQLLKEKGLIKADDVIEQTQAVADGQTVLVTQDGNLLQPTTILPQEQLLTDTGDGVGPVPQSVNNQISLIHTSDGTININSIQGLPQTLETLGSKDGQIVILQIVEAADQLTGEVNQGEIIQHLQVGTNEPITIHQGEIGDSEHMTELETNVPQEVQIVNFTEDLDAGNGLDTDNEATVREIDSSTDRQMDSDIVRRIDSDILQIQTLTSGQVESISIDNPTVVDNIEIVGDDAANA